MDNILEFAIIKQLMGEPIDENHYQLWLGPSCCKNHTCDACISCDWKGHWHMDYGCSPIRSWHGTFQQLIEKISDGRFRRSRPWLPPLT